MGKVERLTNGTTGGPVFVDVKDGKIVRITPMDLDDTDGKSWTIEARGRTFTPPGKTTVSPYTAGHKSMIYSPKRILTPLKRVDFDPKGERNCQNRGSLRLRAHQLGRGARHRRPSEIEPRQARGTGRRPCSPRCGSHHLWGNVGYRHSAYFRFMNLVGFVHAGHNPDSWEGWHWGGMHMWGFSHRLGIPEQYDLLEDALKNTEMIVFWSSDPESTGGGIYAAFESTPRRFWLKELGVKMVFIDPVLQPHRRSLRRQVVLSAPGHRRGLGSGHRLHLAHRRHVRQGIRRRAARSASTSGRTTSSARPTACPRPPEWAEGESGIPAREIRALAREWGAKKTMLAAGGSGRLGRRLPIRDRQRVGPHHDRPGRHAGYGQAGQQHLGHHPGRPVDESFIFPGYAEGGISGDVDKSAAGYRWVYRMFPARQGATAQRRTTPPRARPSRGCASPSHDARAAASGGARASAAPPSSRSSRSTSTRRRAIRSSRCTPLRRLVLSAP